MRLWSVVGLLFTVAILATMPISPEVTQRGVELTVDQVQAITYGRSRRVTRRGYRRAGYAAAAGHYGVSYYGAYYGAPSPGFTDSRQPVGRIRLCFMPC